MGSVPSVVSSFDYINDPLGRRTHRADYYNGSTIINDFIYNIRGEVIGAIMGNDNHSYSNDPIGNRKQSTVYSGQATVTNVYTANNLNQYTSASFAGSARNPFHDLDGNLTWDGIHWAHSWNGENQLISSAPNYWDTTNGATRIDYTYDYMNRRVAKTVSMMAGRSISYPPSPSDPQGAWSALETHRYIWDGWNIAAEITIDQTLFITNISYYTWGLDISGTLQGAGGVGGLLCDTKTTSSGTNTYFVIGDANGNITEYIDSIGATVAHGEHNAFGETKLSGSMKDDFTHWFSSKPVDKETRFVVYQRRYYDPILCKWLSRDPIGERGGNNLYAIVSNDLVNRWDYLGLVKGWNKRVLSNADWHTYTCDEWKSHEEGFSGVANRSSYVRHFEVKSLGAINMDAKLKRTLADELVTNIGIPNTDETTIWAMNFRETALYYTDYKKKTDSTCKSGCRYYIDMLMQVALSEIRSKNRDMIETLVFTNGGDEAKNKVSQTAVHSIDKECVQ